MDTEQEQEQELQQESKPANYKPIIIALLVIAVLIFIFGVLPAMQQQAMDDIVRGLGGDPGPSCSGGSYLGEADELIERWDDANAIASSTSRIALAGPLATLQEIRRDASALTPPNCARELHNAMINYMQLTIDAYLSFLANDSEATMSAKVEAALDAFEDYIMLRVGMD
jgi:hypothetical protein